MDNIVWAHRWPIQREKIKTIPTIVATLRESGSINSYLMNDDDTMEMYSFEGHRFGLEFYQLVSTLMLSKAPNFIYLVSVFTTYCSVRFCGWRSSFGIVPLFHKWYAGGQTCKDVSWVDTIDGRDKENERRIPI